ncbi:MAG: DUF4004 family protein [Clostridium perfringens]|nr:DUF4004 family protein [Clostridium perfringens]
MEKDLISKKDLLGITKISYGQLYRWKRKKLIPEEWFIKKSVTTGQETFFPREKILDRVEEILNLKDGVSLDDLAFKFSGIGREISLTREYIISSNISSKAIIDIFESFIGKDDVYKEDKIFSLIIFNELINSGKLSKDEVILIAKNSKEAYKHIEEGHRLIIKRKLGVCFYFSTKDKEDLFNDKESISLCALDLFKIKERIKKYGYIRN